MFLEVYRLLSGISLGKLLNLHLLWDSSMMEDEFICMGEPPRKYQKEMVPSCRDLGQELGNGNGSTNIALGTFQVEHAWDKYLGHS